MTCGGSLGGRISAFRHTHWPERRLGGGLACPNVKSRSQTGARAADVFEVGRAMVEEYGTIEADETLEVIKRRIQPPTSLDDIKLHTRKAERERCVRIIQIQAAHEYNFGSASKAVMLERIAEAISMGSGTGLLQRKAS